MCSKWLGNYLEHLATRAQPNLVFIGGSDDVDGPMDEVILALQHRLQHSAAANSLERDRFCPLLGDGGSLQCIRCRYGCGSLRGMTHGSSCQHQRTQQG